MNADTPTNEPRARGNLTPMMQQYWDAKNRHPGMLLLFRMGDFYELFGDDAECAARLLGIQLTSRDKQIPMAGFPHTQLDMYLRKLLQLGQRVAVCDQVEDAALAKGLVKRDVTRVVTPGTLTEDDLLDPKKPNPLAAIVIGKRGLIGLAWAEVSTGQFYAADVEMDRLSDELARLAPAECLVAEADAERFRAICQAVVPTAAVSSRPDWTFDPTTAITTLHQHFGVVSLSGFGFDDAQPCLTAAGALLLYLRETVKTGLAMLDRLRPRVSTQHLFLDEFTRRSLELTRTLRDGSRNGSLLAALDRTVTPMGARLLADWLLNPLAKRDPIDARLDAIGELLEEFALRRDLRELLRLSPDLQRLTARAGTGRASPPDLAAIARSLRLLPKLKAKLVGRCSSLLRELESRLELCADLRAALDSALVDNPPFSPREGGLIRPGHDAALDELRAIAQGGKDWIARFQADEIARTGIASLKVGFNRVFGYYIEITHAHSSKVPSDYQRKQTLKHAERYVTPELKAYEEKVLSAEDKIFAREYELFTRLREQVGQHTPRLLATADVLAMLDVLAALAELASARQYCRPTVVDEPILAIRAGRHPVLEQLLPPGTFVPNDIVLGPDSGMFWLVTGPNMAGKSTILRQAALLTLLAHMGSYVPAASATIGLTDRLFTRVGASDELGRGQSTFMVEMTEAANILNNATARSLVVLDEIGRGTSTYDGVSLAWAITEHLHDQVRCRALFATHYHELAQLAESLKALRNYNVLVREQEGGITFLYQLAPGHADQSYGIHVARLAGVPEPVLERACEILAELETRHRLDAREGRQQRERARRKAEHRQPTLFDYGLAEDS